MATDVTMLAIIAACAASLGALCRTTRIRRVHAAGVPLLLAGWLGLVTTVLPEALQDRALLLAGMLLVAVVAAWLGARLLIGHERWLLAFGAAVLTIRLPVPTGDGTAMLLGPLYVVIGIGAFVLVRAELRQLRTGERLLPDRGGATRLLDVGAALLPAAATLSLLWSYVPSATAEALAFYLVPFVLSYALVRAWLVAGTSVLPAAITLIASSVVFALVGLLQAATHEVWWNPKVIDANRFRPDVRTNSLFWDPNIYGRALVVGLVAVVALLLVSRVRARTTGPLVVIIVVLLVALWNTFSQSSWVALAAGLALLGVLTIPPRPRRWVAAAALVVLIVGTPIAAQQLSGEGENGRGEVARTGLGLAAERPVLGWGAGTFETAARDRELERGNRDPDLVASHTTPITVFAELGLLGAFTYLTLLTSAVVTILARWRRTSTPGSAARAAASSPLELEPTGWPAAATIWAGAAFVAITAHSLLYAGFFEDPTMWVTLAVLASLPTRDRAIHGPMAPD
jgi:hypothetical protein